MSVKVELSVDKSAITNAQRRVSMNLPRIENKFARTIADFLGEEAKKRAPYNYERKPGLIYVTHLRDSMEVVPEGPAEYSVVFTRHNIQPYSVEAYPPEGFDVALWTHESDYTPSDKTEGVGPRYLARAAEENKERLEGIALEMVNEIIGSLELNYR
jgi:hypothetical protein